MFGPGFVMQYLVFLSNFSINLLRLREMVALPKLFSCCLVTVIVL